MTHPRLIPEDVRFESYIERSTDGCWRFTTTQMTKGGYAWFQARGQRFLAHRYSYEKFVGPIPEGLQLDHLCRVRNCVNPEHLEPVTCRENLLRGNTLNAMNARKTHCVNGHEFTPENTKYRPDGRRRCAACSKARNRAYYLRDPEAHKARSRRSYALRKGGTDR